MRPRGRGYLNTCSSFRPNTRKFFDTRDTHHRSTGGALSLSLLELQICGQPVCLTGGSILWTIGRETVCRVQRTDHRITPSGTWNFARCSFEQIYPVLGGSSSSKKIQAGNHEEICHSRESLDSTASLWLMFGVTFATRARTTFNDKSRDRLGLRRLNDWKRGLNYEAELRRVIRPIGDR